MCGEGFQCFADLVGPSTDLVPVTVVAVLGVHSSNGGPFNQVEVRLVERSTEHRVAAGAEERNEFLDVGVGFVRFRWLAEGPAGKEPDGLGCELRMVRIDEVLSVLCPMTHVDGRADHERIELVKVHCLPSGIHGGHQMTSIAETVGDCSSYFPGRTVFGTDRYKYLDDA